MWVYFPETAKMSLEEIDKVFDGVRHVDAELTLGEVIEVDAGDLKVVDKKADV